MDCNDTQNDDEDKLPDDVADAWAAVLIDVHEKTKDKATTAAAEHAAGMIVEVRERRETKQAESDCEQSDSESSGAN